jgi:hypothetical protein
VEYVSPLYYLRCGIATNICGTTINTILTPVDVSICKLLMSMVEIKCFTCDCRHTIKAIDETITKQGNFKGIIN